MLSEVSQAETNTVSKKAKLTGTGSRMVVTRGLAWGGWGDAGQRVQSLPLEDAWALES